MSAQSRIEGIFHVRISKRSLQCFKNVCLGQFFVLLCERVMFQSVGELYMNILYGSLNQNKNFKENT